MEKFKIKEDINIGLIELVEKNANFQTQEVFNRLVDNIKRDGQLTSVPFCIEIPEELRKNGKQFIVISGNHRVQAAKMAGLSTIPIMCATDLTNDQIIGIQLSHNEIHGQNDLDILRELMEEIENVDYKSYTGVDESQFAESSKFDYDIIQPTNEIVNMNFTFFDADKTKLEKVIMEIEENGNIEETILIPLQVYEKFQGVVTDVQKKYGIKAYGMSVVKMMELAQKQLDYERGQN